MEEAAQKSPCCGVLVTENLESANNLNSRKHLSSCLACGQTEGGPQGALGTFYGGGKVLYLHRDVYFFKINPITHFKYMSYTSVKWIKGKGRW